MKRTLVFLILFTTCMSISADDSGGGAAATKAGPISSFTVAWMLSEDPGSGFEGSPTYCDLDGDGQDEAIVAVGSGTAPMPLDPAYVEAERPHVAEGRSISSSPAS